MADVVPKEADQRTNTIYVARFAAEYLTLDIHRESQDPGKAFDQICDAPASDVRVLEVQRPNLEGTIRNLVFLAEKDVQEEDHLFEGVHYHTLESPAPVLLNVRVPIKNQKPFFANQAPTDQYLASWDGTKAFVMWEQDAEARIPMAGGHVVLDILHEAAEATDFAVYHQSLCEPGCPYMFGHATLRIALADVQAPEMVNGELGFVNVFLPLDHSFEADDVLRSLSILLDTPLGHFAEMKNLQQHILEMQGLLSQDLHGVLQLFYRRQSLTQQSLWERVKGIRELRANRIEARKLLTRLWLEMSHLHQSLQRWQLAKLAFDRDMNDALRDLFSGEYEEGVATMATVDTGLVRSAAQDLAGRFDARDLALATAVAAVVGGIAGLIGGLAS